MAMSQGNPLALGKVEQPNLNEVIEMTAVHNKKNPQSTLVNVDFSNVHSWDVYENIPGSDNVQARHRVSLSSFADLLTAGPNIQESRIFMPKVYFDARLVDAVTDWVLANCSEVLNTREFNCNDDQVSYAVKLGLALDKYYYRHLDYREREQIHDDIREQIQAVVRGAHFYNNAEMFGSKGCRILCKNEMTRGKTLASDRTHRRVVSKMRDSIADLELRAEKMMAHMGMLKVPEPERSNAEEELGEWQSALVKLKATMERDVSQYRKCDLDSYIVAESLAPATLEKFDSQVFFTGDGDFEYLYRRLAEVGKNVIVVSPDIYLSRSIVNLQAQGVLTVHYPDFADDIWRYSDRH